MTSSSFFFIRKKTSSCSFIPFICNFIYELLLSLPFTPRKRYFFLTFFSNVVSIVTLEQFFLKVCRFYLLATQFIHILLSRMFDLLEICMSSTPSLENNQKKEKENYQIFIMCKVNLFIHSIIYYHKTGLVEPLISNFQWQRAYT